MQVAYHGHAVGALQKYTPSDTPHTQHRVGRKPMACDLTGLAMDAAIVIFLAWTCDLCQALTHGVIFNPADVVITIGDPSLASRGGCR